MARENMSSESGVGKAAPVPFLFEGEHLVRIVYGADSEPWFVGIDVCHVLGISDHTQTLGRLNEDERGRDMIPTPGGDQRVIIVSEPGVYRLMFSSRKPEAERFKRWLAHDVLPSLRRTGRYEFGGFSVSRINTAALNAASRAIGEVRRSLGARIAAAALPEIFGKAGITIPNGGPDQRELELVSPENEAASRHHRRA